MSPQVVAVMSTEDLLSWRNVCANRELVDPPVQGVSPTEARGYLLDYYRVLGQLYEDYNLDPALNYDFSPANGAIIFIGVTTL